MSRWRRGGGGGGGGGGGAFGLKYPRRPAVATLRVA
jgi:hypothetical protein